MKKWINQYSKNKKIKEKIKKSKPRTHEINKSENDEEKMSM
jgi:hypothetical protein